MAINDINAEIILLKQYLAEDILPQEKIILCLKNMVADPDYSTKIIEVLSNREQNKIVNLPLNVKKQIFPVSDNAIHYIFPGWLSGRGTLSLPSDLNKIDFAYFSAALRKNPFITCVSLKGGPFSSGNIIQLMNDLLDNKFCTELQLEEFSLDRAALDAIAQLIRDNKNIDILSLKNTGITKKTISVLAEALTKNNTLTALDLSYNDLSSSGAEILMRAIEINNSVNKINLENTSITKFRNFSALLAKNQSISGLNLSKNNLARQVSYLAKALQENQILLELYLDDCNLNSNNINDELYLDNITSLLDALRYNGTLLQLDLRNNQLAPEHFVCLTTFLKDNDSLVELNLSGNEFTENDIFYDLIDALKESNSMKRLYLSGCSLNQINIDCLGEYLTLENCNLEELDLSKNNLTGLSKSIRDGLVVNQSLTKLILNNNVLTNHALDELKNILYVNHTLEHIGLSENNLGASVGRFLIDVLEKNKSICTLELSFTGVQVQNDDFEKIYAALLKNTTLTKLTLHGFPQNIQYLRSIYSTLFVNQYSAAIVEGFYSVEKINAYIQDKYDPHCRINDEMLQNIFKQKFIKEKLSERTFASVVLFSDGYLKKKNNLLEEDRPNTKFFDINQRVPMEIQMIICNRLWENKRDLIPAKEADSAFRHMLRRI